MSKPRPNDKSFAIPKQLVWEAWLQLGVGRVADADRCGLDSARAGER
jgi:hypothetical protein